MENYIGQYTVQCDIYHYYTVQYCTGHVNVFTTLVAQEAIPRYLLRWDDNLLRVFYCAIYQQEKSRVAQWSNALHFSARGVATVPGSNPGCVTSGCDWESDRAAHNCLSKRSYAPFAACLAECGDTDKLSSRTFIWMQQRTKLYCCCIKSHIYGNRVLHLLYIAPCRVAENSENTLDSFCV